MHLLLFLGIIILGLYFIIFSPHVYAQILLLFVSKFFLFISPGFCEGSQVVILSIVRNFLVIINNNMLLY
jgi:hypothetical protein